MTTLVVRQPLLPLSMSSAQRAPRRLSARLQEKDGVRSAGNVAHGGDLGVHTTSGAGNRNEREDASAIDSKKRKIGMLNRLSGTESGRLTALPADYDEDDGGFQFTRVKKQRPPTLNTKEPPAPISREMSRPSPNEKASSRIPPAEGSSEPAKKRRNKMSFSTPKATDANPIRRSKRLSNENEDNDWSHKPKARQKLSEDHVKNHSGESPRKQQRTAQPPQERIPAAATQLPEEPGDDHSATKIALPFADTPVIRRNKAMREGKSGKGQRRSSLSLRGRRASSLIESGTSNALPHAEVEIQDFYKHIESESLPEPKRMRQLLTWCATRALGDKPTGTDFEDVSVKQAARVIQEEILKEFSNKSEMSDWFGREDVKQPSVPLKERPHPKNTANQQKIQELEEQIKRLRAERESLESLLQQPTIASLSPAATQTPETDLLSPADLHIWTTLQTSTDTARQISQRLNTLASALGPTLDAFADGVHRMDQYRAAADRVASRALTMCAKNLDAREREGRRRALSHNEGVGPSNSPRMDLGSVLRSLARVDR